MEARFSPFLYRNRNAIERMFCRPRTLGAALPDTAEATNFLAESGGGKRQYWL